MTTYVPLLKEIGISNSKRRQRHIMNNLEWGKQTNTLGTQPPEILPEKHCNLFENDIGTYIP
jgi:hypothetical protein